MVENSDFFVPFGFDFDLIWNNAKTRLVCLPDGEKSLMVC